MLFNDDKYKFFSSFNLELSKKFYILLSHELLSARKDSVCVHFSISNDFIAVTLVYSL
jgi:hypothetical protein